MNNGCTNFFDCIGAGVGVLVTDPRPFPWIEFLSTLGLVVALTVMMLLFAVHKVADVSTTKGNPH